MLLETSGLTKSFGGYAALTGVDVAVRAGTIHAVIGPNGAGKTTLFNLVSGVLAPSSGRIRLQGREIGAMRPDRLAHLGVARTFQSVRLFGSLTALENVLAARFMRAGGTVLEMLIRLPGFTPRREAQNRRDAMKLLEMVGIGRHQGTRPGDLALADQRRLEMARALATEPALLLLDEPVAGMNPVEIREASALIRRIRDSGVTVLLTEHHVNLVMDISDVITVLNHGEKIAEGAPEAVRRDERVLEAYLGREEVH